MSDEAKPRYRGRPRVVTRERLAQAILGVHGREPSMAEITELLKVSRAGLYAVVPGHEALIDLACEVVLESWQIPPVKPGQHWASWAWEHAQEQRRMIRLYPYVHAITDARMGASLVHSERVVAALIETGLSLRDAFHAHYVLNVLVIGVVETRPQQPRELRAIIQRTPGLKLYTQLRLKSPSDFSADVFDELLLYALQGIANRAGDRLPEGLARERSARVRAEHS